MEVYNFVVSGRVQGVFYRKFVSQNAMRKQFQGYVKNLNDGTVEAVAALWEEDVPVFKKILEEGSPASKVERITMSTLDEDDLVYDGFEVRS
ncbi:MAG: acylphosphatase [Epsilonproteobacteria bacterium]|nr:acylphosphatase [Campylobacterota bacterium]